MHRKIDFTQLSGMHTYQQTWDYLQVGNSVLFDGLAKGMGDRFVVTGVQLNAGVYSDGLIVANNEFIPFIGGPAASHVLVETIVTKEQFDDNTLKDTYYTKRARLVSIPQGDSFPIADLKRIPAAGVLGSISNLLQIVNSTIGLETEVILSGCEVTDVAGGTLKISSGKVLFGSELVNTTAYNGSYPVYLTATAGWTTAQPSAGSWITFDPYTSQRYVDVLRRASTPVGEIKMFETLTDRFNNGIGRWEMKGFVLMSSLQNRVPVGLWFDGVAVENVSDELNTTTGIKGGENKHSLSRPELPKINLVGLTDQAAVPAGGLGLYRRTLPGEPRTSRDTPDASNAGIEPDETNVYPLPNMGDGLAHENRQPNTVVVYAKRV